MPTFFLGILLLVALINVVGSQRIRSKVTLLPTAPVALQSEDTFASQLTAVSDPAQLRDLAAREHRRVLGSEHLIRSCVDLLRTLSRNLLFESWSVLVLATLFYLFEFRSSRE